MRRGALGALPTNLEYYDFLDEFTKAVKQNYGENSCIDFANHNAFELLAKYGTTHLVFNDDIQGTTVVLLVGLVASLKLLGGSLADHTFLFFGAREERLELSLEYQKNVVVEEARKNIWPVDSKGLIVNARKESLQAHKKPWAHEHEPVNNLLDTVKAINPAAIIGTSGVGRTFTKKVIEAMASINKRPLIMAFSNPTAQSECTTEEAYTWSERVELSSQVEVPFPSVEYNNKLHNPSQVC
uniref:Malic enzyme n=1 Tax=Solanum tuberosum TaxID=4113 RepID=M1BF94_SOLTU